MEKVWETLLRRNWKVLWWAVDVYALNALYLVKEVAKTKYISGISIWDDFKSPRGFDKLDEICRDANEIPLHIFCTKDELLSGIKDKTLKRNIYYWCTSGVKTVKEANEIMQRVYEY